MLHDDIMTLLASSWTVATILPNIMNKEKERHENNGSAFSIAVAETKQNQEVKTLGKVYMKVNICKISYRARSESERDQMKTEIERIINTQPTWTVISTLTNDHREWSDGIILVKEAKLE